MNGSKKFPFSQKGKDSEGQQAERSFEVLMEWWDGLKQNKGDRASLRHATRITEIFFVRAFSSLLNSLRNEGYEISNHALPRIAMIAGLAAHIETDIPDKIGDSFGTPISGDSPPISDLRMRNILARDDLEELFILMRRAISIVNRKISLSDLASIIWNWRPMAEKNPFDSRRRLALDYYAAAPINIV